jgi:hypothetical protein
VQVFHTKTKIIQGKIAITTKKFVSKFCNLDFFVVLVIDDNLNIIGVLHHYSPPGNLHAEEFFCL